MRPIAILALALAAAACSRPTPEPVEPAVAASFDKAGVAAGVEALILDWSKTGQEGRWEDLKALYADDPDFYWVEDGRVAYASRAAAAAGVDRAAAMNALIRSDVSEIAVTPVSADAASFRALVSIGFVGDAFSFDFDGVFTGLAVRRDGKWQFLNGHLSRPDERRPQ
jgi:hypothetical protein